MASNDEYQQQQFWEEKYPGLCATLKPVNFCDEVIKEAWRKLLEDQEKMFYSAQEGSTLDLIWKGKFNTEQLKNQSI